MFSDNTYTWLNTPEWNANFSFKSSIHHTSIESTLLILFCQFLISFAKFLVVFLHFVVVSGIWVDLQNILPSTWVCLLSIVQWLRDIALSNNIVIEQQFYCYQSILVSALMTNSCGSCDVFYLRFLLQNWRQHIFTELLVRCYGVGLHV